jgi:hypothetical protein
MTGSLAAPGFLKPEGVVVYHTAGNTLFKATIEDDAMPKSQFAMGGVIDTSARFSAAKLIGDAAA